MFDISNYLNLIPYFLLAIGCYWLLVEMLPFSATLLALPMLPNS